MHHALRVAVGERLQHLLSQVFHLENLRSKMDEVLQVAMYLYYNTGERRGKEFRTESIRIRKLPSNWICTFKSTSKVSQGSPEINLLTRDMLQKSDLSFTERHPLCAKDESSEVAVQGFHCKVPCTQPCPAYRHS